MTTGSRIAVTFIFLMMAGTVSTSAAAPADLESIQQLIQNLQTQVTTYQERLDQQAKMIEVQGREIADLKNQIEKPVSYIVPKDAAFKSKVADLLQEIRLSDKEETSEDKELRTVYDDGFYLKGKDDTLKIGGWYQLDANLFEKGNEGNTRLRNRRARLDIRGVLENDFEYRLFTQFAGSAANIQEAWLSYKYFPNARLRLGQFKVPFSLESQTSSLWTDFIEKSMGVANLEPAEDLGVMLFGAPWSGRVEYALGAFNGRARTLEDNNDNSDIAGRLVFAPFKQWKESLWRDFYFGGSMTAGHSDEALGGTGFTTSGGSRFYTFSTNTRHADRRVRYGGEMQWIYGPGDIKAEYVGARFNDVERQGTNDDIYFDSWYASASYLLTGERKPRDKWVSPKKNFSLKDGGWGAWEVAARYEQFSADSSPFGLGIATGTSRVDAYTAGLNWWPNKHIRLMFDYVINDFDSVILIGSDTQDSEHLWLARAQYNF